MRTQSRRENQEKGNSLFLYVVFSQDAFTVGNQPLFIEGATLLGFPLRIFLLGTLDSSPSLQSPNIFLLHSPTLIISQKSIALLNLELKYHTRTLCHYFLLGLHLLIAMKVLMISSSHNCNKISRSISHQIIVQKDINDYYPSYFQLIFNRSH